MSKEESMVLNWVFEFQEANHFENTTDELLMHIHNKTREQIAKEMGLTRERVRQIEFRALLKLRRIMRKHGYELKDLIPD